jgi:hypothetical protein
MSSVHFVLLNHEDPHGAHAALRAYGDEHVHGDVPPRREGASTMPYRQPAVTDWGKSVQHAVTKDGGFTFHDHVGDGPKNGFMVSVQKDTEHAIPVRDLTPEILADYRDVHQADLADPKNFLGGWVYKGKAYLDISRHVEDRNEAMDLARQHKQLGIYDIGKGETLMTEQQQEEQPQKAAFVMLPADDLAAINEMRKAAGLAPLVHDVRPGLARHALRLVQGGKD